MGAASPAATPAFTPQPISPTAGVEEPDQYRTASVSESDPAISASTTNSDPKTLSIDATTHSELSPVSGAVPAVPATGAGAQERKDGWRKPWLVASMIMVLLVLFVAGILLSQNGNQSVAPQVTPAPVATSTATAALPAGYVQVEDASGLYSFAVPPNWTLVPYAASSAEYTVYTDPAHDALFEVESFPTGTQQGGAAMDTAILTQNVHSLKASDVSTPVDVTLAGSTWVKEMANVSFNPNGVPEPETLVVQTTTFNEDTFIIFYYRPVSGASSTDAQALPQILRSFTFLG